MANQTLVETSKLNELADAVLPLVSIVINNYNYGRFLGEAIESASGQTYRPIEVIVVDDGSADNSRQVIESWGDKVWAIFKANGGQASALNAGFEASVGELVLFLDSDDTLERNAIETVVHEWKEGSARAFFPLQAVDANGKPLGRTVGGTTGPRAWLGPYCGGSESTSGTVFSRDVLEKVMPIPEGDWRICADYYLCAASSLFGEATSLGQPLGKYRMHGHNNFQGNQPLAQLRQGIEHNFKLHDALFRLTGGEIGSVEHWLGACPEHWVRRITSLRESPQDHPWPDSFPRLAGRLIRAIWRYPYWNLPHKLGHTIFAVGYSILPRKPALALRSLRDSRRGRALGRLLGRLLGRKRRGLVARHSGSRSGVSIQRPTDFRDSAGGR